MYEMRSAGVTGLALARPAQRREVTPAPAELQTGSNQNNTESASVDTMTVVPQTLKDSKVFFLRAEVRSVKATVDGIVTEISKHISDMEQAKLDGYLPRICYLFTQIC